MRKLEVYSRLRKMRRRVVTRKGGRAREGVLRNSAGSRASWEPRLHLLCGLGWLTLLSRFLHKQARHSQEGSLEKHQASLELGDYE